jgi:hypothetical protein
MTKKQKGAAMGKQRLTRVEKLLKKHREQPSPKCNDPKQLDAFGYAMKIGLERLDCAIAEALDDLPGAGAEE